MPVPKTDFLNLRKPPTLLKDGDWIGWGNAGEIKQFKDDLQTEEDLSVIFVFNLASIYQEEQQECSCLQKEWE